MDIGDTKAQFKELIERLRDPTRIRWAITGLMLAIGYVGLYMPLSARIEETTRKLGEENKRHNLANELEYLRAQADMFQARVPKEMDVNECVQYVLEGIRKLPLKLNNLAPQKSIRVGPYQAIVLKVELEGQFRDLDSFMHWVETNERLFRVDSAKIAPARGKDGKLVMQLTLLGMKG